MSSEILDVIVVGCGPVGGLAANLLGLHGLRTLVIERDVAPHDQPRAFSCDDETQRNFQAAGLTGDIAVALQPCEVMDYVDGKQGVLGSVPFKELDFGLSHPAISFFSQPQLEAVLREGLKRFPHVELKLGHEIESFAQDEDSVTVRIKDRFTGRIHTRRARFLLGADGTHSHVRKLLGIEMKGFSYEEPWISISCLTPTLEPTLTHYIVDPVRPGFVVRCPQHELRLDFLLQENERAETMEREEVIERLIAPYVDPKQVKIQRASVYTFHCKVAERWRDRRVFLLGDSVHIMPPFMGQGLCSGIRDAINLCWKLALVTRGAAGEELLSTYETERRPHLDNMVKATLQMGRVFVTRGLVFGTVRNALLKLLFRIPRTRRFLRNFEIKPKVFLTQGFMASGKRQGDGPSGSYLPQPWVGVAGGASEKLDDVMRNRFAVLCLADVAEPVRQSAEALAKELGGCFLRVLPAARASEVGSESVVDVEGKIAAWLAQHDADTVVVRPDRFVFGATKGSAVEKMREGLRTFIKMPVPQQMEEASLRTLGA